MSFVPMPIIFSDVLPHPHHHRHHGLEHLGIGEHPEHLLGLHDVNITYPKDVPIIHPTLHENHRDLHHRHWWNKLLHHKKHEGELSTVKDEEKHFQVVLDVQQFLPEEVSVKVVDKHVVVQGDHDEKKDEHGWVSRSFIRRYEIPEDCDLDKVESRISSDGFLIITVPYKQLKEVDGERVIKIQKVNAPAVLLH